MTENGNKGKSILLSLILLIPLSSLLICLALFQTSLFPRKPVYADPLPSPVLVRGSILDRNGDYLAIQAPDYGFTVHINDSYSSEIASFISAYTDESAISIEEKIDEGKKFIVITEILSATEIKTIQKRLSRASLSDDISVAVLERRKYPQSSARALTDTVNRSFHGTSGIEKIMDDKLSAVPSLDNYIEYGEDVSLTIDASLQKLLVEKYGEKEAALLSGNGEVLAYTGSEEKVLRTLIQGSGIAFPYDTRAIEDGYFIWERITAESPAS